jgi:hypothetical protein
MGTRFTKHALEAIARRGLSLAEVEGAVDAPDGVIADGPTRFIRQRAMTEPGTGVLFLIRVVVEQDAGEWVVVTAYRTTKLSKYGAAP